MIDGKSYFDLNGELACYIDGFPNYIITEHGNVYSFRFKRYIKHYITTDGYPAIGIIVNGQRKKKFIHRLVAIHFIANPDNLPEVDHKNRNREDFTIENLQWYSRVDNCKNRGMLYRCQFCGKNNSLKDD